MTAAERGIRRRQRLFVIFTAVLVLAYARQLVAPPTAGQDFRAFFAAATVAAPGCDPLPHRVLQYLPGPGHRSCLPRLRRCLVPRLAWAPTGRRIGADAGLDQAEPRRGPARRGGAARAWRRAAAADKFRGRQRARLRRRGPGAAGGAESLAGRDPLALARRAGAAAGHRLDP